MLCLATGLFAVWTFGARIIWWNDGQPVEVTYNGDYVPDLNCKGDWIETKAIVGDPNHLRYRCGRFLVKDQGVVPVEVFRQGPLKNVPAIDRPR